MARGKLMSKRCSNGSRKKCLTKKCVKKMNPKAKTFSMKRKMNARAKTFKMKKSKKMNARAKTFSMKKGGKRSSLDEEGRLYKEGKGKYSNLRESDFCGPAGNAPMGTFPVDTEKRCSAALSYARNAPYPDGIVECAMKKAKENGWKCGKNSKQVKKMKKNKKYGGMTPEERDEIMKREMEDMERAWKRVDQIPRGAEMNDEEEMNDAHRKYYLENTEAKINKDGRASLTDKEFEKYIIEKSKAPNFHIQPGGKKMKKNKKGGWVGATIGTTVGLAVGYGVGIGLPGKIKEKFSSNSNSSSDVKEMGNDGFNKVDAPEKKEDTPIEIVPTGGAKCQDDEHHHPGHHKSKKNGCMKNSDMGGSKKKSKGKGKKSKGKGKKSAYSQFLSKELKRVGDAHPDWAQPKVFKEAVSNWSNSK